MKAETRHTKIHAQQPSDYVDTSKGWGSGDGMREKLEEGVEERQREREKKRKREKKREKRKKEGPVDAIAISMALGVRRRCSCSGETRLTL